MLRIVDTLITVGLIDFAEMMGHAIRVQMADDEMAETYSPWWVIGGTMALLVLTLVAVLIGVRLRLKAIRRDCHGG